MAGVWVQSDAAHSLRLATPLPLFLERSALAGVLRVRLTPQPQPPFTSVGFSSRICFPLERRLLISVFACAPGKASSHKLQGEVLSVLTENTADLPFISVQLVAVNHSSRACPLAKQVSRNTPEALANLWGVNARNTHSDFSSFAHTGKGVSVMEGSRLSAR